MTDEVRRTLGERDSVKDMKSFVLSTDDAQARNN